MKTVVSVLVKMNIAFLGIMLAYLFLIDQGDWKITAVAFFVAVLAFLNFQEEQCLWNYYRKSLTMSAVGPLLIWVLGLVILKEATANPVANMIQIVFLACMFGLAIWGFSKLIFKISGWLDEQKNVQVLYAVESAMTLFFGIQLVQVYLLDQKISLTFGGAIVLYIGLVLIGLIFNSLNIGIFRVVLTVLTVVSGLGLSQPMAPFLVFISGIVFGVLFIGGVVLFLVCLFILFFSLLDWLGSYELVKRS